MIFSLRRTTQFSIENHEICSDEKFKKLIAHFAVHVKELTFGRLDKDIPINKFEYIMRSMTNLVELTVEELKIDASHNEIRQIKMSPVILPSLKKLSLTYYDLKSMGIVTCLESNSLNEFHFHGNNRYDFTQFFQRHMHIKNVTLSGKLRHSKGYEHLQLTHLQIYNCKNEFLREMIVHQPRLQHLELLFEKDLSSKVPNERKRWPDDTFTYQLTIDDDVFQAICVLTQLETLSIQIGRLTANVIANISKLVNLKKLVVKPSTQGSCNQIFENGQDVNHERACLKCEPYKEIFRTLIDIPLSTLESFTWWSSKGCGVGYTRFMKLIDFDSNKIVKMAKCFPNLKHLAIKIEDRCSNGDKINVHNILQAFNQLKTLELQITSTFEVSSVQIHKNIEHIRIEMMDGNLLTDMMRTISMPNLNSLDISKIMFKKNVLQNVQATIPNNLKDLKLNFTSKDQVDLTVDNFNILREIFDNPHRCKIIINCDFYVTVKINEFIDSKMNFLLYSNVNGFWSKGSHDIILWK